MVEAMMAITLVDHVMMQNAQCELFPNKAALEDQPNPMGKTAVRSEERKQSVIVTMGGPVSQRVDEE